MPPSPRNDSPSTGQSDSSKGVREAYDSWADSYDADENRTRDLDRDATRTVLSGLRVPSVVEAGCGTGKNTGFLRSIAGAVHGFDLSLPMLRHAHEKTRRNAREATTPAGGSLTVADIQRHWPFADGSADLAVCNLVLEHVAELGPVFAEAHRVLAPGGRFFVCELHPERQALGTKARFERDGTTVHVRAFAHSVDEFLDSARAAGFRLERRDDWWHEEDAGKPPRLASFLFRR